MIRELSNLNPTHLKLIRDKVFSPDDRAFKESEFYENYLKDIEFNGTRGRKFKRFANENQSLIYRNAMVVDQMSPLID